MKNIFRLALILTLISCESDDNNSILPINQFKGKYKIIELTSNIPMDLNGDGISSNNFYEELYDIYFSPNALGNGAHNDNARIIKNPSGESYSITCGVPKMFYNQESEYIYIDYHQRNSYASSLDYNINTRKFSFQIDEDYYNGMELPKLLEVQSLNDSTLSMKSAIQYYFIESDSWQEIELTGIYERFTNN